MSSFYLIQLSNKFNNSYTNVLRASKQSRVTALLSQPKKLYEDYNYIRKDGVVNIADSIEEIKKYNYCLVNNNGVFEFYFIVNYHYVADKNTAVELETDVFATYFDDITNVSKSYIRRMHLPQGAEIPKIMEEGNLEYKTVYTSATGLLGNGTIMMAIADGQGTLHGKQNACRYYAFKTTTALASKLDSLTSTNKINSIVSLTYIPDFVVKDVGDGEEITTANSTFYRDMTYTPPTYEVEPYYKKLLQYPYCRLSLAHCKNKQVFPQHYFSTPTLKFRMYVDISPTPSCMMMPLDYKGEVINIEHSFLTSNYPQVPYAIDSFKMFMARALPSIVVSGGMAIGGINPLSAVAVGGAVGNVLSAVNEPPAFHNGNYNIFHSAGLYDIYVKKEVLNDESFRYFNHLFDRKGYAIEGISEVNLYDCEGYKYIEGDLNINSKIPSMYYDIIRKSFNDGVTLWDGLNTDYRV